MIEVFHLSYESMIFKLLIHIIHFGKIKSLPNRFDVINCDFQLFA